MYNRNLMNNFKRFLNIASNFMKFLYFIKSTLQDLYYFSHEYIVYINLVSLGASHKLMESTRNPHNLIYNVLNDSQSSLASY